jgi:hypothetical protein
MAPQAITTLILALVLAAGSARGDSPAGPAAAQRAAYQHGSIGGFVKTSKSRPLFNAVIGIKPLFRYPEPLIDVAPGTGPSGYYRTYSLVFGTYRISVSEPGYRLASRIVRLTRHYVRLDFRLMPK